MALDAIETGYYEHARTALPRFLFQASDAPQDIFGAYAKLFGQVDEQIREWLTQAYISSATDIYLDQHARDYGTSRRGGETDPTLRARLQSPQAVVTRPRLLAQVDAILAAGGFPTGAVMVEIRYDRMHYSDASPGGTRAFWSRGYRLGSIGLNGFVVILPAGAVGAESTINEYLRVAKAAGFKHSVERVASALLASLGFPMGSPFGEIRIHRHAHAMGHDIRDLLSRLGIYLLS